MAPAHRVLKAYLVRVNSSCFSRVFTVLMTPQENKMTVHVSGNRNDYTLRTVASVERSSYTQYATPMPSLLRGAYSVFLRAYACLTLTQTFCVSRDYVTILSIYGALKAALAVRRGTTLGLTKST